MWVCTNEGFISIVQDEKNSALLKVRARKRSHLEALFPGVEIKESPLNDYRYRVFVDRGTVARLLSDLVLADKEHPAQVNYGNFKNSVRDDKLHDLYSDFWTLHHRYQSEAQRAVKPVAVTGKRQNVKRA